MYMQYEAMLFFLGKSMSLMNLLGANPLRLVLLVELGQ